MPIQADVRSELGEGYVYTDTPYGRHGATSYWPYLSLTDGTRTYLEQDITRDGALAQLRDRLGVPQPPGLAVVTPADHAQAVADERADRVENRWARAHLRWDEVAS